MPPDAPSGGFLGCSLGERGKFYLSQPDVLRFVALPREKHLAHSCSKKRAKTEELSGL